MHSRAPSLGRRSFALVLAYLLALQAILIAWAVLAPAAAGAFSPQSALCSTHANSPAPASGLPPAQCPCGPLCHAGGAPILAAPSEAWVAVAHPVMVPVIWHVLPPNTAPKASTSLQQARAPPLTA